jgi:hypothetical protein
MTQLRTALDPTALKHVQDALESWRRVPFSSVLRAALRTRTLGAARSSTLSMLRAEDAPTLLADTDGRRRRLCRGVVQPVKRHSLRRRRRGAQTCGWSATRRAKWLVCWRTRRAFTCLWLSGLFAEARQLLKSSVALRREVSLGRRPVPIQPTVFRSVADLNAEHPGRIQRPTEAAGRRGRHSPSVALEYGDLPSGDYDDGPIADFEEAEAAAKWDLWGESETARVLRWQVERVAQQASESSVLNVGLSGPTGIKKENIARAIHGLAGRVSFATLGPGDGEVGPALAVAAAGGTLYLRECSSLSETAQVALHRAITSQTWQGMPLHMLLIVDLAQKEAVGPVASRQGKSDRGFSATLGQDAPGDWGSVDVPVLRKYVADVPVLVNKMLERLQADGLTDVRQHLAVWFQNEITKSKENLEEGWLARAVFQICEAECPTWSPPQYQLTKAADLNATRAPESSGTGTEAAIATCWEEVTFVFTSSDAANVVVNKKVVRRGMYDGLEFADRRADERASFGWNLLKALATSGEISKDAFAGLRTNVNTDVQDFRRRLKRLVGLEDNPLHPYDTKKKCWRSRFVVVDKSRGGQGGGLLDLGGDTEDMMPSEIRDVYDEDMNRAGDRRTLHRNFAEGITQEDEDITPEDEDFSEM